MTAKPNSASFSLRAAVTPATQTLTAGETSLRLVTGNAGDHRPVHALLRAANQAPSYEDFISWLDEPSYEPSDRLLVKWHGQILAHVHVLDRVAWFDSVRLPVGGALDLATLPEYREAGYERLLVDSAEQAMRGSQAVVALARTDRPDVFQACGWSEVRGQSFTEANVSDILARLSAAGMRRPRRARALSVRSWRHVELDALQRVYRSTAQSQWGALDRSEPYWRWLVGRNAHDELIVAVLGPDQWDELDRPANIVGYAVTRGSQVVELSLLPGFATAGRRLLARACQDAIERDHRTLSLHLPANDPLHKLMLAAGGSWMTNRRAATGSLMVKLLDAERWIESIYPTLIRRAKALGLKRPCHLIFDTGRRNFRLELTRRSGRLARDDDESADVRCTPEVLATLLVGNLDVAAARQAGQLVLHNDTTANELTALFPTATFWQSQFDTLRF